MHTNTLICHLNSLSTKELDTVRFEDFGLPYHIVLEPYPHSLRPLDETRGAIPTPPNLRRLLTLSVQVGLGDVRIAVRRPVCTRRRIHREDGQSIHYAQLFARMEDVVEIAEYNGLIQVWFW